MVFDHSCNQALFHIESRSSVLIWVKAAGVTSHKKQETMDKGSLRPNFLKSGHCDRVLSVSLIFSPQSEGTSINCSCSLGSLLLLLSVLLKGFLAWSSLTDVLSISLNHEHNSLRSSVKHDFTILTTGALSVWETAHISILTSPLLQADLAYETINLGEFLFLHPVVISSVHVHFGWFRCSFRKAHTSVWGLKTLSTLLPQDSQTMQQLWSTVLTKTFNQSVIHRPELDDVCHFTALLNSQQNLMVVVNDAASPFLHLLKMAQNSAARSVFIQLHDFQFKDCQSCVQHLFANHTVSTTWSDSSM